MLSSIYMLNEFYVAKIDFKYLDKQEIKIRQIESNMTMTRTCELHKVLQ